MTNQSDDDSQRLLSLAALVGAVALLILALGYVGVIGGTDDGPGDREENPAETEASASRAGASPPSAASPAATSPPVSPPPATSTPVSPPPGSPPPRGPTAKLSPTPGPSPTVGTLEPLVVEGWDRFEDTNDLSASFSVNEGWADNSVEVSLLDGGETAFEGPGIKLDYDITSEAPNDYVGFEWDLDARQDWTGYALLVAPVETTDSSRELVIQWHELSGEVWRWRTTLADAEGGIRVPLEPSAWEWADWSEYRDLAMDVSAVTRMGIFVGHTGPGAGSVTIGPLSVQQ